MAAFEIIAGLKGMLLNIKRYDDNAISILPCPLAPPGWMHCLWSNGSANKSMGAHKTLLYKFVERTGSI